MITLDILFVLAVVGGAAALIDGILRVRTRKSTVLSVIEIIVAAAFLISLFGLVALPIGQMVLAIAVLVVLILQLVLRGSTRRSGVAFTVVGLIATAAWIVLKNNWIVIPGLN
jgi:hypothetical protein